MLQSLKYHIRRGEYWQRLVIVKDKRTHRVTPVTTATALMQVSSSSVKIPIGCTVSTQGGILLVLSEEETSSLVDGEYSFDIVADPTDRLRTVARGVIEVSTVPQITPLEGSFDMEIAYLQRTDYRLDFSWTDEDGVLIAAQSARMQARTAAGVLVLDLKWFATAPSEAVISALPAVERGYLAPKTGKSLEMHISDTNTIAVGSYEFDMQAQDAAGDWDKVSGGMLTVTKSVTNRST